MVNFGVLGFYLSIFLWVGSVGAQTVGALHSRADLAVGDINGDGFDDIVAASSYVPNFIGVGSTWVTDFHLYLAETSAPGGFSYKGSLQYFGRLFSKPMIAASKISSRPGYVFGVLDPSALISPISQNRFIETMKYDPVGDRLVGSFAYTIGPSGGVSPGSDWRLSSVELLNLKVNFQSDLGEEIEDVMIVWTESDPSGSTSFAGAFETGVVSVSIVSPSLAPTQHPNLLTWLSDLGASFGSVELDEVAGLAHRRPPVDRSSLPRDDLADVVLGISSGSRSRLTAGFELHRIQYKRPAFAGGGPQIIRDPLETNRSFHQVPYLKIHEQEPGYNFVPRHQLNKGFAWGKFSLDLLNQQKRYGPYVQYSGLMEHLSMYAFAVPGSPGNSIFPFLRSLNFTEFFYTIKNEQVFGRAIADYDQDGLDELAFGIRRYLDAGVWRTGFVSPRTFVVGKVSGANRGLNVFTYDLPVYDAVTGDFNGDGLPDVLLSLGMPGRRTFAPPNGRFSLWLNSGVGLQRVY